MKVIPFVRRKDPTLINKALLLDYDGTLRECIGGNGKFPVNEDQIEITLSGKVFKDLHNKWYENGKKIVPKDLELNPITILVWFLDDGCICKKSKTNLVVKFSTDGFNESNVLFLRKILQDYINETMNIFKNGSGFILKGSTKAAKSIIQIIEPIYLDCMNRKAVWR